MLIPIDTMTPTEILRLLPSEELLIRTRILECFEQCGLIPSPKDVEALQQAGEYTHRYLVSAWVGRGPMGRFVAYPLPPAYRQHGWSWSVSFLPEKPLPSHGSLWDEFRLSLSDISGGLTGLAQRLRRLSGREVLERPSRFNIFGVDTSR